MAAAAEPFGDEVYYFGDLHAHTAVSGDADCSESGTCTGECGPQAGIFATAFENRLDFVAFSDHTNGAPMAARSEWDALAADVIAANDPASGFVTIPAAEFFLTDSTVKLGHRTLLFFGDDTQLAGLTMSEASPTGSRVTDVPCASVWTWLADLEAARGDVLTIPHHPAATLPMATNWACHDDTFEPAVEVYSGHGSSLGDGDGYDPVTIENPNGSVHVALDPTRYSLRLGFLGGTDRHDTRPGEVCAVEQFREHPYAGGLTVVVLDSAATFDRAAIHDAIVGRSTYATSGPQLPVRVSWSYAGLEIAGMGDEVEVEPAWDLVATVSIPNSMTSPIRAVVLVSPDGETATTDDGAGTWRATFTSSTLPAWVYARVEIDGEAWYGLGACPDAGDSEERVWTSPTWFDTVDDVDGDGIPASGGDCAPFDPTASPAAEEIWYDGVDQDCAGDDDWDADGDGYDGDAAGGPDCDDADPDVHPGVPDLAEDGADVDCDGQDAPSDPGVAVQEVHVGGELVDPEEESHFDVEPGERDGGAAFARPGAPRGCDSRGAPPVGLALLMAAMVGLGGRSSRGREAPGT